MVSYLGAIKGAGAGRAWRERRQRVQGEGGACRLPAPRDELGGWQHTRPANGHSAAEECLPAGAGRRQGVQEPARLCRRSPSMVTVHGADVGGPRLLEAKVPLTLACRVGGGGATGEGVAQRQDRLEQRGSTGQPSTAAVAHGVPTGAPWHSAQSAPARPRRTLQLVALLVHNHGLDAEEGEGGGAGLLRPGGRQVGDHCGGAAMTRWQGCLLLVSCAAVRQRQRASPVAAPHSSACASVRKADRLGVSACRQQGASPGAWFAVYCTALYRFLPARALPGLSTGALPCPCSHCVQPSPSARKCPQ